jgi:hypothetical protein
VLLLVVLVAPNGLASLFKRAWGGRNV